MSQNFRTTILAMPCKTADLSMIRSRLHYRGIGWNVILLVTTTIAVIALVPVLSFNHVNVASRSKGVSAVFASTIVPNPQNRIQHLELWKDYFGLSVRSSNSPLYYNDQRTSQRHDEQPLDLQRIVWFQDLTNTIPIQWSPPIPNHTITTANESYFISDSLKGLSLEEISYLERKERWAAKYTSVDALRNTFGTNRRGFWGDLDAKTTRRLYKTLLPRALLELHCNAVGNMAHPEDLAPLAYKARVAAKMYARERCELPARIAANLYDGFRQWKQYGHFNCKGMSYRQLWEKYASVILHDVHKNKNDLTMEDVTAKICLKILERSCQTNSMIDNLVKYTENSSEEDLEDLKFITSQLEADARSLLRPYTDPKMDSSSSISYSSSDLLMDSCTCNELSNELSEAIKLQVPSRQLSPAIGRKSLEDPDFHQQKLRLIRSMLRMKRKFERFHYQQRH